MAHIPMRATVRLPSQSAQLSTASPMDAANPMRACSESILLTDVPTDFEKSGGILKNLVRNLKNTNGINATAQENIILIVVGNSVSKIAI
jgi:ABC-type microcin C transport system duplicated ATPase subunit YejF